MNLSQNNNGVEKLYMDLLKAYYPLTEQRLKHISPNNVMDRALKPFDCRPACFYSVFRQLSNRCDQTCR